MNTYVRMHAYVYREHVACVTVLSHAVELFLVSFCSARCKSICMHDINRTKIERQRGLG